MVVFKGANVIGPENRDERGAYEEMEDRLKSYMKMEDDEWEDLYHKMYNDRKYPGHNNVKLMVIPSLIYTGLGASFAYEFMMRGGAMMNQPANLAKVALIPVFGVLTLRNLDIAWDTLKYRNKYPEMYQP